MVSKPHLVPNGLYGQIRIGQVLETSSGRYGHELDTLESLAKTEWQDYRIAPLRIQSSPFCPRRLFVKKGILTFIGMAAMGSQQLRPAATVRNRRQRARTTLCAGRGWTILSTLYDIPLIKMSTNKTLTDNNHEHYRAGYCMLFFLDILFFAPSSSPVS